MAVAQASPTGKDAPTIVEVAPYRGLFGTMRSIMYEEGERTSGASSNKEKSTLSAKAGGGREKKRKGQGAEGLWRGWRVGVWGLIGVWGAATLGGSGSKSGEF